MLVLDAKDLDLAALDHRLAGYLVPLVLFGLGISGAWVVAALAVDFIPPLFLVS